MAFLPNDLGWFPFRTMALKDDLPTSEQLAIEASDPANAPPRATLAIVAEWAFSAEHGAYTFKGCHPVTQWRRPTLEEMAKARHFYRL